MKQAAVTRLENAMGRNLLTRNFLAQMNDHFKDDIDKLEQVNRLLRGLLIDQQNLINMRTAADRYTVQNVVLEIWEEP